MDHYIVSARKYRPSTFSTVIGQKPLTAALKHAIATDRLAHAYLFCGSRGVGKTSCARIFAKTINCSNRTPDGEACNECESCKSFNMGNSLNIIELDAASHNGIDDIKGLIEQVRVPPTQGRYRVFIIDEVHMLSAAAFNAFLKTLEEPPEYVVFVLATTEKHKIIPTILSRCQIYDFSRITINDMMDHLTQVAQAENIVVERSALNVIARKADGAMRDALSIFDQVAAATMGNVTYAKTIENLNILDNSYYDRLVKALLAGDVPAAMLIYKEVREKGFDSQFFINGLGLYMRDLMLAYTPQTLQLIETSDDERAALAQTAAQCPVTFIYGAMDLCNQADLNFRVATNKQFLIELTLIKISQLGNSRQPERSQLQPTQPTGTHQQPTAPAANTPAGRQPEPTRQPAATNMQPTTQQSTGAAQRQTPTPPAPQSHIQQAHQAAPTRPQTNTNRRISQLPSLSGTGASTPAAKSADDTAADDSEHHPAAQSPATDFTDQQLSEAWQAFIEAHPTDRILCSTMLASQPVRQADVLNVSVGDRIQADAIGEFSQQLAQHLRQRLGNNRITINVVIAEKESSPITWTQREVLDHMIERRPELKNLISAFSLHLS